MASRTVTSEPDGFVNNCSTCCCSQWLDRIIAGAWWCHFAESNGHIPFIPFASTKEKTSFSSTCKIAMIIYTNSPWSMFNALSYNDV